MLPEQVSEGKILEEVTIGQVGSDEGKLIKRRKNVISWVEKGHFFEVKFGFNFLCLRFHFSIAGAKNDFKSEAAFWLKNWVVFFHFSR